MSNTRLYSVRNKSNGECRLVEAVSAAQAALRIVAQDFTVTVPSALEAAGLVASGVQIVRGVVQPSPASTPAVTPTQGA